jgi:hypothetical protein
MSYYTKEEILALGVIDPELKAVSLRTIRLYLGYLRIPADQTSFSKPTLHPQWSSQLWRL